MGHIAAGKAAEFPKPRSHPIGALALDDVKREHEADTATRRTVLKQLATKTPATSPQSNLSLYFPQ